MKVIKQILLKQSKLKSVILLKLNLTAVLRFKFNGKTFKINRYFRGCIKMKQTKHKTIFRVGFRLYFTLSVQSQMFF